MNFVSVFHSNFCKESAHNENFDICMFFLNKFAYMYLLVLFEKHKVPIRKFHLFSEEAHHAHAACALSSSLYYIYI
jgi:hypothetical protein